ncbi:DHHC palmitoyltransferase-domain-containing protein [Mycena crocata]|nr:DHHC palmitoyltransferase-domain-containing protein [Mycena crocata]
MHIQRRGTRLAELCIQFFVLSTIAYSLYITSIEIAIEWLISYHGRPISGGLYLASVLTLIPLLGIVYTSLALGRNTHNIPRYPLPDKDDLTEPYECVNLDGDLATCIKCRGAWKPPRTHHCSTCGVCRMDFDHHCPWVGNCVTKSRMKTFLFMLLLAPIAYLVSVVPIYRTLMRHASLALAVSRRDAWANQVWWDWYGSWVFFGGPVGRWIFGMALGFRILKAERKADLPLIEQPNLRLFTICALGLLFSAFTLILASWTAKDLLRGLSTLDVLQESRPRNSHRFVCIHEHISSDREDSGENVRHDVMESGKKVFSVLPGERIYDLGFWINLKDVFDGPYRDPNNMLLIPDSEGFIWPKISPAILNRMRKTTSASQNISTTDNDN